MKDISIYKLKFFELLESKSGQVKPLITEQFVPTQQHKEMFNMHGGYVKADTQAEWFNKNAEHILHEAEVAKSQKNQNLKRCDACKVTVGATFADDLKKETFCYNYDLFYYKEFRTCGDPNAYATLINSYGTSDYVKVLTQIREMQNYNTTDPHSALQITAFAVAFIPAVGPWISAALGIADAALYYKEEKYEEAGLALLLESLPLWGPSLKLFRRGLKLTTGEAKTLSKKVINKEVLTPKEKQIIQGVQDEIVDSEKLYKSWLADKLKTANVPPATLKKLDNVVVGGKEVGKDIAKQETATAIYKKTYEEVTGASFKSAQKWFLSDKSLEDNAKMQMALKSGWRPGQPVPEEFRTKTYAEDLNNLNKLDYDEVGNYLNQKNQG